MLTREFPPPPQLNPPHCPPTPLSPTISPPLKRQHHLTQHHIDTTNTQDSTPNDPQPNTRPPPCQTHTITHLVEALNKHDQHTKTLIQSLPDDWAAYNDRGSFVTKRQLLQSAWGGTQGIRQPSGTPTSHPNNVPATNHYGHSIHNPPHFCHLHGQHGMATHHPKPLPRPSPTPTYVNPITIFNMHKNNHFTTLITNNHTYCYYDSLNLHPPSTINMIHNTLLQWYT